MFNNPNFRELLSPGASLRGHNGIRPNFRLDTAEVPVKEQLDFINQEFSALVRVSPVGGKGPRDGFRSQIDGYVLKDLPILDKKCEGYNFLSPSHKDPCLTDSFPWILVLRLEGHAEFAVDGQILQYRPGNINVRTPDNQLAGSVSDNSSLMLYLQPDHFVGMEDRFNWLATAEGAKHIHPLLGRYLMTLGRILPDITDEEAPILADTTYAMIRAFVSHLPDDFRAAQVPIQATRLEIAHQYVAANLTSPNLTPQSIGQVLGLSPRRLREVFEDYGGAQNYIRARRLNACFKAIMAHPEERPVMKVGENFGFTNSVHFSRAFKAQFGWSPSDVRDRARQKLDASKYENWLIEGDTPLATGRRGGGP